MEQAGSDQVGLGFYSDPPLAGAAIRGADEVGIGICAFLVSQSKPVQKKAAQPSDQPQPQRQSNAWGRRTTGQPVLIGNRRGTSQLMDVLWFRCTLLTE